MVGQQTDGLSGPVSYGLGYPAEQLLWRKQPAPSAPEDRIDVRILDPESVAPGGSGLVSVTREPPVPGVREPLGDGPRYPVPGRHEHRQALVAEQIAHPHECVLEVTYCLVLVAELAQLLFLPVYRGVVAVGYAVHGHAQAGNGAQPGGQSGSGARRNARHEQAGSVTFDKRQETFERRSGFNGVVIAPPEDGR